MPQERPLKVAFTEAVVPVDVPFRYSPYPVTPALSVAAVQATVIELAVAPVARNPLGTVGGCVSELGGGGGHGLVGALILACEECLPAASYASTASV